MKPEISRILRQFKQHHPHYLAQSSLAAAATALVLLVVGVEHAFIVGSMGSTAFTVFAMPGNVTAQPRNVLGGHLTGLACGLLHTLIPFSNPYLEILGLAPTVGLAMFIMVALDFEHPPAAGTALGAAISGYTRHVILTVIVGSLVFVIMHRALKRWMHDLV